MSIALVYNLKADTNPTDLSDSPAHSTHSGSASAATAPRHNDVYAEWDTLETIKAVRVALEERCDVMMVEANEQAFEALRTAHPSFVFNIAEGMHGVSREAQIPAMLEMLQIPYLGSNPLTLAVCLDKARAKEILSFHRVPTASFAVVATRDELDDVRVKFPVMVKPLHEGSSKGIYNSCVARSVHDLEREVDIIHSTYGQPALIEEFLPGREFTVGILGNGLSARTLPIVEISFDALPEGVNPIYSYEAKWIWDRSDNPLDIFQCPAAVPDHLRQQIQEVALDAYRVLGCRDWCRVDVRLDAHGKPNVIELNPLPGILPKPEDNSCLPKAARADGMSYNDLINAVLEIAMTRCGLAVPPRRQLAVS